MRRHSRRQFRVRFPLNKRLAILHTIFLHRIFSAVKISKIVTSQLPNLPYIAIKDPHLASFLTNEADKFLSIFKSNFPADFHEHCTSSNIFPVGSSTHQPACIVIVLIWITLD